MKKRIMLFFIFLVSTLIHAELLESYDVIWDSQSQNSQSSMPLGGGDIGLNVWVENDELMFYLAQSGTFDENNSMLKLGRVRVKLSPNPFTGEAVFKQRLNLQDGNIEIQSSNEKCSVQIDMWVDVFSPTIHLEVSGSKAMEMTAIYESWRTEDLPVADSLRSQCFSYTGYPGEVITYKDTIAYDKNAVQWYHRNKDDSLLYDFAVKQQGLEDCKGQIPNTQKGRTFGGVMTGKNLVQAGTTEGKYINTSFKGWSLKTKKPQKRNELTVYLNTSQTDTIQQWQDELKNIAKKSDKRRKVAKKETIKWWNDFWQRGHVFIRPENTDASNEPWQVGRNYQLFRYMLGCNAYGKYPSKFNGSLFTVDPVFVSSKYANGTPDYRSWGGGSFTAQNQRLVYWPMLKSGDFDMMASQFDFYKRALPAAEARTKFYWGHDGASFTEQVENFGLPFAGGWGFYDADNVGRKRTDKDEFGVQFNRHTKHQYNHQLEFSYMILEYYKYSGEDISKYMPFVKSSIKFYNEHYKFRNMQKTGQPYDEDGKLVLYPSTSLETYKYSLNPTDVIVALKRTLLEAEKLPEKYASNEDKAFWQDMLSRLPEITIKDLGNGDVIYPAVSHDPTSNSEFPELYTVYPYAFYGVGLPNLDLAKNTWYNGISAANAKKTNVSWHQNAIFAAHLGITDEAADLTIGKLKDSGRRFPAFWGPGHDWVPDFNHGGSGMIGLQDMLVQTVDEKIILLPAWSKDWDVDFKLHLPKETVIECVVKDSKIESLTVTPKSRMNNIIFMKGWCYEK